MSHLTSSMKVGRSNPRFFCPRMASCNMESVKETQLPTHFNFGRSCIRRRFNQSLERWSVIISTNAEFFVNFLCLHFYGIWIVWWLNHFLIVRGIFLFGSFEESHMSGDTDGSSLNNRKIVPFLE